MTSTIVLGVLERPALVLPKELGVGLPNLAAIASQCPSQYRKELTLKVSRPSTMSRLTVV